MGGAGNEVARIIQVTLFVRSTHLEVLPQFHGYCLHLTEHKQYPCSSHCLEKEVKDRARQSYDMSHVP